MQILTDHRDYFLILTIDLMRSRDGFSAFFSLTTWKLVDFHLFGERQVIYYLSAYPSLSPL